MQYISKNQAHTLINRYSQSGQPFLFVISYSQQENIVLPLGAVDPGQLLYSFPCGSNDSAQLPDCDGPVRWTAHPESYECYERKFRIVQRHLHAGNSFLVNLTCRTPVTTNLSLRDIYLRSHAPFRLWVRNSFVCFSPERFITIDDGLISSFPMKGTLDASLPDAVQQLLGDEKESAEHATIVDLIRNDLSIVSNSVRVPRYRYVERLQTNKGPILQTSSQVCGTLPGNYREHLADILFSQLPAGSITGAPKPRTVQIISEAEDYQRGFYTGVMGISDGTRLHSAVMIRFIEQQGPQLWFKAGGGITARSNSRDEYNEIIQKTYVPIY